jgi:UDP-N-acetylglucosamine diphosphorylase/glucosamine-1-phosphate N-acetyltransferase
MRLCLVEDKAATGLAPLSLTRPVFDLLLGATTLAGKIARAFGAPLDLTGCGVVVRSHLEARRRLQAPQTVVNDADWLARGPTVVVNGRWVPPVGFEVPKEDSPWVAFCEGRPACALVGPEQAAALRPDEVDAWFEEVAAKATPRYLGGVWVRQPWDLVVNNADHLIRDFEAAERIGPTLRQLSSIALIGPPGRLSIHGSARIDPYTALDTTQGPITIDAGVMIQPFTRIEGPSYIGPHTQLYRANIRGGVTLGPHCRIGGEIEASVIQGHTNKYHEGFLGHSYVGEWVNLGAITSNSDLRNDYAQVFADTGAEPIPTGQTKVGCFLGDHTRTGMGCMLNTGTIVGVMCNLLPAGRLLPRNVPSFTTVSFGRVAPGPPLDQLFQTARIVMGRRGMIFSALEEQLFLDLHEQTCLERERTLQRARGHREDRWPVASPVEKAS